MEHQHFGLNIFPFILRLETNIRKIVWKLPRDHSNASLILNKVPNDFLKKRSHFFYKSFDDKIIINIMVGTEHNM